MTRGAEPGHLYGVGVGPGDPDLMTLRAAALVASADVVAYHRAAHRESTARGIAAAHLGPGAVEEPLVYPVTTGSTDHPGGYYGALADFYLECTERLRAHLAAGRSVVVLAEGDPLFYGSFMYVHDVLREEFPTEVVPGVTSVSAASAAVGTGLSRHEDTLTVLPGTLPVPELARRLADTDAAVVMKLGRTFANVREALRQAGRLDDALYVERASSREQRVLPVADVAAEAVPYMSVVVVPGADLRADAAGRAPGRTFGARAVGAEVTSAAGLEAAGAAGPDREAGGQGSVTGRPDAPTSGPAPHTSGHPGLPDENRPTSRSTRTSAPGSEPRAHLAEHTRTPEQTPPPDERRPTTGSTGTCAPGSGTGVVAQDPEHMDVPGAGAVLHRVGTAAGSDALTTHQSDTTPKSDTHAAHRAGLAPGAGDGPVVHVVGLGPGPDAWLTPEAAEVLAGVQHVVGYAPYVQRVTQREGLQRHPSGNTVEVDRARHALELALGGESVAVVSGGDAGVFGMAAAVFEAAEDPRYVDVPVHVVPGVTAAHAASALAGALLGGDHALISLSDRLKPWDVLLDRLVSAVRADLAVALYNPRSRSRPDQLGQALDAVREVATPDRVVVVAKDVGRNGEELRVTTLGDLDPETVDMRCLVIIGSSRTRVTPTGRVWTPRFVD
ncbi:precorrin-2 C(20)-methyltransferase [Phycicoccus sp. CSK15P-2]|uniref:precorrin-2 C(20)-methyltransferase n=1 Tax=Phycicoccus sp. CSK15P-2 TaxID=2807627 RepID=UPI001EF2B948|nr:precorrin-2 C(20)-methyltransferase [Phycicoccus sp. CSK15P-2]